MWWDPGGRFVVERCGCEAAVQDPDQPIGELTQGSMVPNVATPKPVVVGAGTSGRLRARATTLIASAPELSPATGRNWWLTARTV